MTDASVPPLTTRTRIALAIARGVAAAYGHDNLTAEHVAIGLLREGENPAVAALHHAGVPYGTIRRELERDLQQTPRTRQYDPLDIAIPTTDGEQLLLSNAIAESRSRHADYIG